MSSHVFAWAEGFGWTVMPARAPFVIERLPDPPRALRVVCGTDADDRSEATVVISDDGDQWNATPEPLTAVVSDTFDVLEGSAHSGPQGATREEWRIASSLLTMRWPEGFTLQSLPGSTPPVFELVGPEESRLWLQGPLPGSKLPRIQEMLAPGQTLLRVSRLDPGPMVEAAYSHEGSAWRMLHCVVRWPGAAPEEGNPVFNRVKRLLPGRKPPEEVHVLLVSAQTPREHVDLLRAAVEEVAASITPAGS